MPTLERKRHTKHKTSTNRTMKKGGSKDVLHKKHLTDIMEADSSTRKETGKED